MAITVVKNPSTLRLKLELRELDENGKKVTRSKSFGNVRPEANADDLFTVAVALASLQSEVLMVVQKLDSSDLTQ